MKNAERRVAVECERIDERLAGLRIVPIARRLAGLGVVVVALEATAHLLFKLAWSDSEQANKGRANERDRVLRRHRVVERGRIQNALATDEPGLARRTDHHLEDPIRPLGPTKRPTHVDDD